MEVNGHIEPSAPPGLGIHLLEGSGESSGPPGFEVVKSVVSRPKQNINELKGLHGLSARRQTRSQTKRERELVTRSPNHLSRVSANNMSREGSYQANKSLETTDSIAKLAKESLDMGKLLRIKVIGKEEVTVKRLITSLKNGRKGRTNSRTN